MDDTANPACIGGCVDFAVTGVPPLGSINVVVPLSAPLPAGTVYRKLVSGTWRNFTVTSDNKTASAARVGGSCPPAGDPAYTDGLAEGNDCIQLTITDGGPNDADGAANGIIRDPGGAGVPVAPTVIVESIGGPDTGGCTLSNQSVAATKRRLVAGGRLLRTTRMDAQESPTLKPKGF